MLKIEIDGKLYSIETIVGMVRIYNRAIDLANIFQCNGKLHAKLMPGSWGQNLIIAAVEYAIQQASK